MNIIETNGKDLLEKYNKLSEEEQLNFWSGLLLLLALEDKTPPTQKGEDD